MKEEQEEQKYNAKGRTILLSFLAGGLVGAGVALLLAPKAGKDLRKDIADLATNARDKVASTIEEGKGIYEGSRMAVKEAVEAGKKAFTEERERHLKTA